MKLQPLLGLILASRIWAAPVASDEKISDAEILKMLLLNPHILPQSSNKLLNYRVQQASKHVDKRSPQWSTLISPGLLAGTIGTIQAAITSFKAPDARAPKATVAEVQPAEAKTWAGSKGVKVRYGPYRIPPISEMTPESVLLNEQGMGNTVKIDATKPCTNCTILTLDASLEHADGSPAENQNGAWFHHAILLNAGPQASQASCGGIPIENLMMAGNEKSPVFFGLQNSTVPSGYRLTNSDTLILNTQLMNMEDKEKWVWVTMTYQYLDGAQPGFKNGRNMWDSLSSTTFGVCPISKVNPFGKTNLTADFLPLRDDFLYEYSIPWISPADGLILATGGHMHDGGTDIEIFQNDKLICKSVATYGKAGGEHGSMGGGEKGPASNMAIEHIVHQSRCEFKDGLPIKKGDKVNMKANYDFRVHPGMRNAKGELDALMGIVGTLVAF